MQFAPAGGAGGSAAPGMPGVCIPECRARRLELPLALMGVRNRNPTRGSGGIDKDTSVSGWELSGSASPGV